MIGCGPTTGIVGMGDAKMKFGMNKNFQEGFEKSIAVRRST